MLKHALIGLFLVAGALATFTGSFTDSLESEGYGGTLYICTEGGVFYGMYSEVGVMYGRVSGDGLSARGTWVEGGSGSCLSGPFNFVLTDDGFSGSWACAGAPDVFYEWTESRLSSERPTDLQCAFMDRSLSLDGEYSGGGTTKLSMCAEPVAHTLTGRDHKFTASYQIADGANAGQDAYERGNVFSGGSLAGGSWCNNGGDCGSSVWFYLRGEGLVNVWWKYTEAEDLGINFANADVPGQHGITQGFERVGPTSHGSCRRNKELSPEVGSFYEVYELLSSSYFDSSSPASLLSASLALGLVAVLAALL